MSYPSMSYPFILLPTAILGLLFHQKVDIIFNSILIVGVMLLITGTLIMVTRFINDKESTLEDFTFSKCLVIGVVQGLAVMPGISRSGSTISIALILGISRETAARFSFLLSLPAIVGAELLSIKGLLEQTESNIHLVSTAFGTLTAFIVGYFALVVLLKLVKKGQLYLFTPYCYVVGIIAIILHYIS